MCNLHNRERGRGNESESAAWRLIYGLTPNQIRRPIWYPERAGSRSPESRNPQEGPRLNLASNQVPRVQLAVLSGYASPAEIDDFPEVWCPNCCPRRGMLHFHTAPSPKTACKPPRKPTQAKAKTCLDLRKRSGAPGRIRTADARLRRAALYPLSYEGLPALHTSTRPERDMRPRATLAETHEPPVHCRTRCDLLLSVAADQRLTGSHDFL